MNSAIIQSILDNDLYKISMQNAVIKHYPSTEVVYKFINRGGTIFPDNFDVDLKQQIEMMSDATMTLEQREWLLQMCPYLSAPYVDFLWGYRFNPQEVKIQQHGGDLSVTISGPWYRTILWEVPLMALISELYFRKQYGHEFYEMQSANFACIKAKDKGIKLSKANCVFADFGTRRRFSQMLHSNVVQSLSQGGSDNFVGTSNMLWAHKYNLNVIGTHAHEWFSFHAVKYGYKQANSVALGRWADTYSGDLGVALTDTFTTDIFFNSFDTFYSKLFDGVRHDSGDPYEFACKTISHYESLGIDPASKTIVFSDGLNTDKAIDIQNKLNGRIKISFGIGTHFTNDIGATPLNMVIKLWKVKVHTDEDWVPAVKLSDVSGKNTGEADEVNLARQVLRIKV